MRKPGFLSPGRAGARRDAVGLVASAPPNSSGGAAEGYACLVLPFPPTANNLFSNGRRGRFPSKAYRDWQAEAAQALRAQGPLPSFPGKVALTFSFGRPDRRRRDVFNYVKAPEDALVTAGILADDSLVERGTVAWCPDTTGCRIEIEALP